VPVSGPVVEATDWQKSSENHPPGSQQEGSKIVLSRRPSFHNSLKSSPELRLQYHNETAIDTFIYIKLV
jgi:hypothetical protein